MNEWEWQLLEDKNPVQSVEISGVPIRRGDRVRLRPRAGGDVFDLALEGKIAAVESIEQDYEGKLARLRGCRRRSRTRHRPDAAARPSFFFRSRRNGACRRRGSAASDGDQANSNRRDRQHFSGGRRVRRGSCRLDSPTRRFPRECG